MRAWLFSLLLLAPALASAQPLSVQEALLRAKPAVAVVVAEVAADVTVSCGTGPATSVSPTPYRDNGTGFFLTGSGWLLTNAHVVAAAHRPGRPVADHLAERAVQAACLPAMLAARNLQPGERPEVEEALVRQLLAAAMPAARVALRPSISVILPNGRRLPASVVKYSPPVAGEAMAGQNLALLRVEAADVPAVPLGDSTQAKIGDRLSIIGFPDVVMSHELLGASARVEASITTGAVSGFRRDRANQAIIQTDAAAETGNSGGPAVNAAGEVIGVLTFVTGGEGGTVQGFNFVIPSAAVKEFLEGTPVALDERSRFNAAWHAGLRDFFAGRHSRAARQLAEANRLLPELPDVQRIAAENEERAAAQPWLPWRSVGAVLVVASIVGYGSLLVSRRRRNRFRVAPSEVARMLEGGDPPALLDARDDVTYARSPMRLPRARHVTEQELATGVSRLEVDPDRTVVAYCT